MINAIRQTCLSALLGGFCVLSLLAGCAGTDQAEVALSEEDRALLDITAKNILELEKAKDYDRLYEQYAGKQFKERVSQRVFLKLAHCTETHLGAYQSYSPETFEFIHRRNAEKEPVHMLNLTVYRDEGAMSERMVFIQEGLNFRLKSLRWLSTRPAFLGCIQDVLKPESSPQPSSSDS